MEGQRQLSPEDKVIRRIRKKLRQIEHLELLDRELNDEELLKICQKEELREELQKLLKEHRPDEADIMKRPGDSQDTLGGTKKAKSGGISNSEDNDSCPDTEMGEGHYSDSEDTPSSTVPPSPPHSSGTTSLLASDIISKPLKTTPQSSDVASQPVTTTPQSSKTKTQPIKTSPQSNTKLPQPDPVPSQPDSTTAHGSTPSPSAEGNKKQATKSKKEAKTDSKNQSKPEPVKKSGKGAAEVPKKEKSPWKDEIFDVYTIEGHNDIVLAVDCTEEYILSGSRDTTVRVWRVGSRVEERSLRGHTASVTSVAFLPTSLTSAILDKCEADEELILSRMSSSRRVLSVSGGLDCTLKVWDVVSGDNLGSIYTYNGITCMGCGSWGVVSGTEGGRLEFWSLVTRQRTAYVDAFQSQVSTVWVNGNEIYAGSEEGEVGVWKVTLEGSFPTTVYFMEPESSSYVPLRHLATLVVSQGKCYLGDSGPNIKVLAWRRNCITKLVNHIGEVGLTDSLAVATNGDILAASYFVDSGCPSINVRDSSGQYKYTLVDGGEGRYLAMSTAPGIIVTGGHKLKVWIHRQGRTSPRKAKGSKSKVVRPTVLRKLSAPAVDSGSEEDTDWASSSEDEEEDRRRLMAAAGKEMNSSDGDGDGKWWCNVL
ncbi:hypothetical protein Pcinc_037618 [Petrolisthes cinctipes]|uniref:Uncharacterized protein n=1 Tax=Petrolisthes cinctipes TaxID=88211 RepID=A0AAE1BVM1_PETCI|nr:hypothetical protein Pcinc_037618 [Petrolisthes cinctipes]